MIEIQKSWNPLILEASAPMEVLCFEAEERLKCMRNRCGKVTCGSKRGSALLEGHTFTWLTFDEAGKSLPEEGLSRILLDEQSLGGDLEEPATALQAIRTLSPGSSSVTDAAKSLAGHRGIRPSLEGHTFT